MTLQVQGSGPVRLLVADCSADLQIRGMAAYEKELTSGTNERKLLGNGRLSVTLEDVKSGQMYQSLVPLEGETLEQIFEHYLSQSEQVSAFLRLRADAGALCGLLLEKLPGADSRDPDGWNRVTHLDMLRGLGRPEVEAILAEQGEVLIRNEMCNHEYRFGAQDIERLFATH